MATKIKYVQLEPAEVLLDFHTSRMTPEQFGCYWLIMMHLYCQGGNLNFDIKEFSFLCNCTENFEKVWEKIESKFQKHNGQIRHKRVSNELRRAKKFIQHQRSAGRASARARQNRLDHGSADAQPSKGNEREVKVSEDKESEEIQTPDPRPQIQEGTSKTPGVSGSVNPVFSSALSSITARSSAASGALAAKQLAFYGELREIIRPRSESDLTCFHRLSQWLVKEITFKRFNEHIFGRVLDIARESATGSRNPAAVFMSRLKKELNYNTS